MKNRINQTDVAKLVLQSFFAGWLFQYIVPNFLAMAAGTLSGSRPVDLTTLKWTALMATLIFIFSRIWRLYLQIKGTTSISDNVLVTEQ